MKSTLLSCLLIAGLLLQAMPRALGGESKESAKSPNVLLICIDDLKPRIGCYGDAMAKTPNIDRLAQNGVKFENAYCNQAVCSPSRNALLVGLRPQSLGIYDLQTNFRKGSPNAVTLPQHFKANGYYTQSFGKIFHVGQGNNDDPLSWSAESFKPKGRNYQLPENQGLVNPKDGNKAAAFEAADAPDEVYSDWLIADAAIRSLADKAQSDQPWFLAVGFLKPHLPFVAPKKYWDLYDRNAIDLAPFQQAPMNAPAYALQSSGELRAYSNVPAQGPLSESLQRELIHGYLAAVSFTDHQIGRVLSSLKELGLNDDTIIVLWGDHGWHLGDHGMWCKHSNYEQATRIPVIVSAPGKAKGVSTKALIESVDIYPTLCELAGLPTPEQLDGKSFANVLSEPSSGHRDHTIQVYPRSKGGTGPVLGRSIRNERFRLVQWKAWDAPEDTADWELYDYQADPQETRNLASEQPEVVSRLRQLLQTHPNPKLPAKTVGSNDQPPGGDSKKTDRGVLFSKKDSDSDGFLSHSEFMSGQKDPDQAAERFKKFDLDNDGKLSRQEFVTMGKSGA